MATIGGSVRLVTKGGTASKVTIIRSLIDILTMVSFMLEIGCGFEHNYFISSLMLFSGNELIVQYSTIKMWFHEIATKTNFEY